MGTLGDSMTLTGRHLEGNTDSRPVREGAHWNWPRRQARRPRVLPRATSLASEQSLETLKGPNGTVLLFFRSADW